MVRNVRDEFSVRVMFEVAMVLNAATIWSMKGSLGVVLVTAGAGVGAGAAWVSVAVGFTM